MKHMNTMIEIMNRRYACKLYAPKAVEQEKLHLILEAGRLSPTSFGFEPWEFHIVQDSAKRKQLSAACFDQESVATAPITLVLVALKEVWYEPNGEFVAQRASRFPEPLEAFIDDYQGYYQFLHKQGGIDHWSRSQGYIAAANMMSTAAAGGIQSCAIEGFIEEEVLTLLQLDPQLYTISLAITFGYPADSFRPKIREPLDSLVHYH